MPIGKDAYKWLHRLEIKNGFNDSIHLNQLPILNVSIITLSNGTLNRHKTSSYYENEYYYLVNDSTGNSVKHLWKHFYHKKADFYTYKKRHSIIRVNPVIHFENSYESGMNEPEYINTRGVEVKGNIDGRVGFYTYLTDNQFRAPLYVRQRISERLGAFPGGPWVKSFKADEEILLNHDTLGTVDFFNARGFVNFRATPHILFQFGHDKQFIGPGYRSLVLSDNSNSSFFLKLNTCLGKFSYQNLFMELNNWPEFRLNNLIQKKYAAIHHLSVNINDKLNLGLFESVIFARGDTSEYPSIELQYLNPIIFYRSVEHGLGSPDNATLGFDLKYNIKKKLQVYAQFVLDDLDFQYLKMDFDSLMVKYGLKKERSYDKYSFWLNKWGIQLGIRYVDVAGIENLDLQLEYNRVRPYMYAHGDTRQNLSHYRQELAHPLGSNFAEKIFNISYKLNEKLDLKLQVFQALYGLDSLGSNYGQDVFKNSLYPGIDGYADGYFNIKVGQGILTHWKMLRLIGTYQLKHNMFIDLICANRNIRSDIELLNQNSFFIGLGIRLNSLSFNHDF